MFGLQDRTWNAIGSAMCVATALHFILTVQEDWTLSTLLGFTTFLYVGFLTLIKAID